MPAGPDQLELGASRAAGERRRREGTPLVSDVVPDLVGGSDPTLGSGGPPVLATRTRHPAGQPVAAPPPQSPGESADAPGSADSGMPPRSRPHRPVPRVIPTAAPGATAVDGSNRVRASERRARRSGTPTAAPEAEVSVGASTVDSLAVDSLAVDNSAVDNSAVDSGAVDSKALDSGLVTASAGVDPTAGATATPTRTRPPRSAFRRDRADRPRPAATATAASTASGAMGATGTTGATGTAGVAAGQPRVRRDATRLDGRAETTIDAAAPGRTRRSAPGQASTFRPRIVRPDDLLDDHLLTQALDQAELTPGIEDVLSAAIGVLRTVAAASGLGGDEVEAFIAKALAFMRRRLTGDYVVDDFGYDDDYTEHLFLPLMRFLYRQWFRVEVRGIENIPTDGGALVVANHSGTIALDAQMLQVAIHDEHTAKRTLRLLGADLVFRTPLMGTLARKQGATLAATPDAERLLTTGEVVGVFPEGFKGVGKPYTERYKLQRFGRGGFVSAALRTGTPIIPCSIVGAEETYPLVADIKLLARLFGAPYFPVTPTWPLLGPLGLLPLPSKWIIEFGEPVPTEHYGSAAADDPMLVFDLTDQVRETIQQTLYSLLMLRRSVFS